MRSFFCTVVFVLTAFFCEAQTIPIRHLTIEDGLPSNTVYFVYTNSKGYLWIATDKGLARYNGIKFEIFTTSNGLPDNEIFNLIEDHQGRLWISTFRGDLCYYKDDTFHTAGNTPWLKLPLKSPNFIGRPSLEKDGSLLHPSTDGNTFAKIKGETVKIYNIEGVKKSLIGDTRPMHFRQLDGNRFQAYYVHNSVILDSNAKLIRIVPYKDGYVYGGGGSAKKNYIFSPRYARDPDDNPVMCCDKMANDSTNHILYINRKDSFFITTYNGLWYNNHKLFLKGEKLTYIDGDIADNVWTSSQKNGIFILSKYIDQLKFYPDVYKGNVLLAKNIGNTLLYITSDGSYYKLSDNRVSLLYKSLVPESQYSLLTKNAFFISDRGDYVFSFGKNNWLLSGALKGQLPLKKTTLSKQLSNKTTKEIFELGGNIFMASISSITKLNYDSVLANKASETEIVHAESDNDLRIFSRAADPSDSSIWFSRADGIFRISNNTTKLQPQFKNQIFRQLTFLGDCLVGFTAANELLICSNYKGNVNIDRVRRPDCIWENIYKIDKYRAIISTNNYYRLLTFEPGTGKGKTRYTLRAIEDAVVPLRADYIATGTDQCSFFKNGSITVIETAVLFEKTPPPVPVFSTFKTQDKNYTIRPEINISYDESKTINIVFDNISFTGKEVTCQYSISDSEEDKWQDITGNEINLNTPGYGTYFIKIRSKTLSSGYSRPATLKLTVEKPFWASLWFIGLCIVVLIAIIWGTIVFITWRKLRKKQKEHEADMKYQQSEYKALNALMNPHFIFNSLNNIQGLINKDEKRTANQFLVIFSNLIRQNMHNISKGFISLQEELNLIENYLTLEKLRFKELVNYEILVDEEVDSEDIMIPPLMIQPLVENAVKHGLLPKQSALSKVTIRVYEKENTVFIEIEDNGIGLVESLKSQNKLYESFGLSNLQKRTDHLRKIQQHEINIEVKELKNDIGTVKGTLAMVIIKLNEA